MKLHYNLKIIGKVQGVGFRFFVYKTAVTLRLTGIVKNQNDGSVLVEIEGTEDLIKKLIKACQTGPQNASVVRIETNQSSLINYTDFKICR